MAGDTDEESDPLDNKCGICCNTVQKRRVISCKNSKCKVVIHIKCFENIFNLFTGIIKSEWKCKNCCDSVLILDQIKTQKDMLEREIEVLNELIEQQKVVNSLQSDKINYLNNKLIELEQTKVNTYNKNANLSQPIFYSDAVKTNAKNNSSILLPKSDSNILFVHNKNANFEEIKQQVKSKILSSDSANHKVHINKTKPIKNGLLIDCPDKHSVEIIKEKLSLLDKNFRVSVPNKLNPRLIISNIGCDEIITANFVEDILNYNNIEFAANEIKLITTLKRKYSLSVIVEVSPMVRKYIMQHGYLFIGLSRCPVHDHIFLQRCYNCLRYGHKKMNCQNSKICSNCTGPHEHDQCDSKNHPKCINCMESNQKYKTSFDINHTATDQNCQVNQLILNKLVSRISYD